MKKRVTSKVLMLLCLLLLVAVQIRFTQEPFSGGSGTEASPYLLSSLADLEELSEDVADGLCTVDKHFRLTNHIDASATADTGNASNNEGAGFDPIGADATRFKGIIHGGGFEVRDIYINRPDEDFISLIGFLDRASITSVGISGSITGSHCVGGLVGYSIDGTVDRCYSTVTVSGSGSVGGLVGYAAIRQGNSGNLIKNSYATGSVTALGDHANVGGLVGLHGTISGRPRPRRDGDAFAIITHSYATGKVTATGKRVEVGGLVGRNYSDGRILDSYWDTETSGQEKVACGLGKIGGLGKTTAEMKTKATYIGWDGDIWSISTGTYPYFK